MAKKTFSKEDIRTYIQRTNLQVGDAYRIRAGEIKMLAEMVYQGEWFEAICLAYKYGMAKGVRMSKRRV